MNNTQYEYLRCTYDKWRTYTLVANAEGNPEEMFEDAADHQVSSPLATTTHNLVTNPQQKSIQAKANKLMAKAKHNKLPIEESVQANVFTKMKKQLPKHVPQAVAMFVKPCLNNTILEKLCDILFESISLDQTLLDEQDTEPILRKRPHDNQDPPTDREWEKRKKRGKDGRESSFKQSKKDKAPMDYKSGSVDAAKRKSNWLDMLLKSNIDQDEDCILGLSTVTVEKKIEELIKKDKLTIADLEVLEEAQWSNGESDVSKPRSFDKQMSKSAEPHSCFYNRDFYYLVYLSTEEKCTSSLTKHFAARYHNEGIEDMILDRSSHKVYSDKRIITIVSVNVKKKWGYDFITSIKVKRTDKKEYEFSYADFPRLILNDVEDIRVVIKKRIEDLQLGVESYQRTLNLTKTKFYFSGIYHKIPYTTSRTEKGVVQENLMEMVNKNKLGHGNERLEEQK
ncbi:hypothetical protein Tco_0072717 [Tanacetum coccineum]